MPAIPIVVMVIGYWVLYAGVKQQSLLDAWNCTGATQQTPVAEPGQIVQAPSPPPQLRPQPVLSPGGVATPQQALQPASSLESIFGPFATRVLPPPPVTLPRLPRPIPLLGGVSWQPAASGLLGLFGGHLVRA